MVLQRTIENLRERPHDERRAVAFFVSLAVMAIIFVAWFAYFLRTQSLTYVSQTPEIYNEAVANVQEAYSQSQTGWVSTANTNSETKINLPQKISAEEAALEPESLQILEDTDTQPVNGYTEI